MIKIKHIFNQLFWSLAAIICLILLIWSAAWTWAEHLYQEGSYRLATSVYTSAGSDRWKDDWSMLERANYLNPLRAEYTYQQAYTAQQLGGLSDTKTDAPKGYFTKAEDLYQKTLLQRAYWDRPWIDLAHLQLQQGKSLDSIFASLDKARLFAPHEPLVRRSVLEIIMPLWSRLEDQQQQYVISNIRYLLQQDYRLVIDLATSSGWEGLLKPLLVDEQQQIYFNRRIKKINKAAK